ncbi:MAG TPA: DUF5666 domain-containing protein [Acidimicrobiales bacterium]|nr:DUF5666 domain-containing protein [Acidimicrobiales bacterium]
MSGTTGLGASGHHRRPIMKRAARWLVCVGLGAGLVPASIGGLAAANAAPLQAAHVTVGHHGLAKGKLPIKPGKGDHHNITTIGTVASVGTGVFTLNVANSPLTATATTYTVNVSSTTKYREPGVKPANFADVLVGDKVRAAGNLASPGTMNADSVFIYQAKVSGTVATVNAGGFTLTTAKDATVTVNVSASTVYREPRPKGASFSPVMVGDKVQVIGAQAGAGVVDAISVLISPSNHAGKGHGHH